MTQHLDIQDPGNFDATDYQDFERQLFDPKTPTATLEKICMTLAHLPTAEAQALLAKFRESGRAHEVIWLECAIEEGQMHYLSPNNEEEERDFLALKVIQEMEDQVLNLEYEYSKVHLRWEKAQIKLDAIKSLQAEGELAEDTSVGYETEIPLQQKQIEALRQQIDEQEKIIDRIRQQIQTERFKNVDSMTMRHCHFDGEE